MPKSENAGKAPRKPTPDELEVAGLVPLLEPFFRGSVVRDLMPAPLRGVMEAHGLTPRHGAVLPQLLAGQPLTVGEIARRLQVSLSTASELVGALSRAGIVDRAEDPANRRRVLVSLAEEHRLSLEAFIVRRTEPLLRALEGLSADEKAGFLAGLTAWVGEVQR
ncbi:MULTISPECIES: MarR family winged helix-turn-helix transcriptional regulator [unclassified Streptomyces]|uniref:MarR family winged helix-turn-helix transcriptional regulator n=1 Tax=unclassified Streptomyces TaxID=2593676 RepID=UPI00165517AF|nr:MarR family transcriptional regulator [Streptomyces sp. CB02980]MCB8902347.1 MarR family transcriptional regulator [Streptomyces sp. CB02980]